jgi:putative heme iron utilization protein
MTADTEAITPLGRELGGSPPASFAPVATARRVLRTARTAALATLDPRSGYPLATLVNVAADADGSPLMLLSRLALHTRNIAADARVSLLLAQLGRGDPMAASERLSVAGRALPCDDADARRRFLARHPKAKLYADFPDFALYRLETVSLHLNGGFARAGQLAREEVLLDLAGCEALLAAEERLLAEVNAEQAGALARCATGLLGESQGAWRATGIDPEGIDLACGERQARLLWPGRVTAPEAARAMLRELAERAGAP